MTDFRSGVRPEIGRQMLRIESAQHPVEYFAQLLVIQEGISDAGDPSNVFASARGRKNYSDAPGEGRNQAGFPSTIFKVAARAVQAEVGRGSQ
jgi:hypothetical protein